MKPLRYGPAKRERPGLLGWALGMKLPQCLRPGDHMHQAISGLGSQPLAVVAE